jgi:hypothetical protein
MGDQMDSKSEKQKRCRNRYNNNHQISKHQTRRRTGQQVIYGSRALYHVDNHSHSSLELKINERRPPASPKVTGAYPVEQEPREWARMGLPARKKLGVMSGGCSCAS